MRAETLVIGTLDASRNGEANLATGIAGRDMRASLEANADALGFDDVEWIPMPRLADLSGIDLLFLHNAFSASEPMIGSLSIEEDSALMDFVASGGSALLLADGFFIPSASSLVEAFEVTIRGPLAAEDFWTVSDPRAHPITGGPFGDVAVVHTAWAGWITDLGPYAKPVANLDATGFPSIAAIEADAIAQGSGRVAVTTDANPFGSTSVNPSFYFSEHEVLFLNMIHWLLSTPAGGTPFLRGDANGDGRVDIGDMIWILQYQFAEGPAPSCVKTADVDDSGGLDIGDPISGLNYLFANGEPPMPPFEVCGADPSSDGLACESYAKCP